MTDSHRNNKRLKSTRVSPFIVLGCFMLAAFFAELIIMILLEYVSVPHPYHIFIDAVLLALLIFPALLFFVYRPLAHEARKQEKLKDELEVSRRMLTKVLDSLDGVVYVVDIISCELLYLNKQAKEIFGDNVGKICWQVLGKTNQDEKCSFCSNEKLIAKDGEITESYVWERQSSEDGRWYHIHDRVINWVDGRMAKLEIANDFTDRKKAEIERENLIVELQEALEQIKALQGILPICSHCKKIRNDEGYWKQVEDYVSQYAGTKFSHSICPACMKEKFPEYDD